MSIEIQGDHVLFVDDEVNFLNSIKRALIEETYEKYFAKSAFEALKILTSQDIAVVVTDLQMPEISGMEFLKVVKKKFPDIIRIIVTGVSDIPSILAALHAGETHRYLTKPINVDSDLIPTIRQSLELFKIKWEKKKMVEEIMRMNKELKEKNEEIGFFRQLAETADDKKTMLLDRLRKELVPIVVKFGSLQEKTIENMPSQKNTSDLKDIMQKALKLKELLKEIEEYFVQIDFYACENDGDLL
jgi:DNA-binding NtrC family response regulator